MPTVTVQPDELRRLIGTDRSDTELTADLFALGLEYEGSTADGAFELEFAPDRLDRLSAEGIARSLRYHLGVNRGVEIPRTNPPDWTIEIDRDAPPERTYVTGAIARDITLGEAGLRSLIQLQEKLHQTIGRSRTKGSIGIHDLSMIRGSMTEGDSGPRIRYTGIDPDADRFVPLESNEDMTPGQVLDEHPTGRHYSDLVAGYARLPAFYDGIGLFSFPPIINGRRTELTADSRDLLIEMTGTDQWTIDRMLSIICYALDLRGATIESVTIEYPEETIGRPDLELTTKRVGHDRIERTMGIPLDPSTVIDCFERSGLSPTVVDQNDEPTYAVEIPSYRVDILHPVDLVDDVGRAYGFNDLVPRYPDVSTVGGRHRESRLEDVLRAVLVGLGFEDLLNFNLISDIENFERMQISTDFVGIGGGDPARIKEPYSEEYPIVRTWVLPSLLMVLENNTHRSYPQNLAEIGMTMSIDETFETGVAESRNVAGVLARSDATYEDAKGILEVIARNFDLELRTPPRDHPSFFEGRVASIELDGEMAGVVGEIHPEIIVGHDLEVPVAAFEFRLDALDGNDRADG